MTKTTGKELEEKLKEKRKPPTLQEWVDENKDKIKLALPKGFTPQRFIRIAMGALRDTPKLAECTQISFISALMSSIQLGLEPNTILGQAYIIPYWNSKLKCREAQFQIGYKGLLELAYRTGEFLEIYAQEVYKGDYFEYLMGTEKYIKHIPCDSPETDDRKNPIITHVYAIYRTTKGATSFVVWTIDKLERHRDRYVKAFQKGGARKEEIDKFSAWIQSPVGMYRKTTLRDLLKYADTSVEFRRILEIDETVKKEIKPDMIEVKPIYEYDATEEVEEEKLEEKIEEKKEPKKKPGRKAKVKSEKKEKIKETFKEEEKPTAEDLSLMSLRARGAGYHIDEFEEYYKNKYNIKTKYQLTKSQYDELIAELDEKINKSLKKAENIGA